ncbi:MAG TPA: lysophospholipid acyltransferase family protein [Thermoleophilaceae bacterium]|nr:lysophospholipid acyltransferase family protein [Thermoleophilaceae bacterium]
MTTRTTGTGTGTRHAAPPRDGGTRGSRESFDGGVPPFGPAIAFLRRLRHALESGPTHIPAGAVDALSSLPGEVRAAVDRALRRAAGDYEEDDWGFDEEFALALEPLLSFLYEHWWRVEASGVSNVPSTGRAMLVANHAGILPWDGTMISVAIRREHPRPRYPRFLVLDWAFTLPFVSVVMRKVGGVVASPYNASRLLEQDELVAVFPEGAKGAGKDFSERYRLQRFGRGGFVEIALRARAPIIPVAVVGSEEIYPKVGESRLMARAIGAPYFPITPTFPLLGPLGAIPLPSKWRIEFGAPIRTDRFGPSVADDRALVFELSERVREEIQRMVYENLVRRGSAFISGVS